MQLINYRCFSCLTDKEWFQDEIDEYTDLDGYFEPTCGCGDVFKRYNFKNNGHRYLYNDMKQKDSKIVTQKGKAATETPNLQELGFNV